MARRDRAAVMVDPALLVLVEVVDFLLDLGMVGCVQSVELCDWCC